MRILILDTYYDEFLRRQPIPLGESYQRAWSSLMHRSFGTSDFYSRGFKPLGIEAQEVIVNHRRLQSLWVKENGSRRLRLKLQAPLRGHMRRRVEAQIVEEQIKTIRPDVLYVMDASWPPPGFIRRMKEHVGQCVVQHATSISHSSGFGDYDLFVSAIPHLVEEQRRVGRAAHHLALGFGLPVLDRLPEAQGHRFHVVHVGGYGPIHAERNRLLSEVAKEVPITCWGYGIEHLPRRSPLRSGFRGEAWGLDMYAIRSSARFTITSHISEVVGSSAANCTMYEATGVGSCLVVDAKSNLSNLFDVDREVVSYASPAEAVEKIRYLSDHEDERARIASAGQHRTLRDHTYDERMRELAEVIRSLL